MARKGVREQKSEGLSVSSGVYAYHVVSWGTYPPAVGDV